MKRLLIILTVLFALGNVWLWARSWWTNMQWETEMYGMASYAGALQADSDFQIGILRLYELSSSAKIEDTKRKDGPFEIWTWPNLPEFGHAGEFTAQRFVEMYNEKMRFMHAHPEQFNSNSRGVQDQTIQPSVTKN
jgi:hypothetical protein